MVKPGFTFNDGRPTFLLGVNYWSRGGGPRMWSCFDEDAVRQELRQMRTMGLNTCRSFCFLPSFMPTPPALSATATGHLARFFDLCHAEGMGTIPSFLVGHMSGENYDFPGQRDRSPYTVPELLDWQQVLVQAIVELGSEHPAVLGYLASNEMPLWGGRSSPEVITRWAETIRDMVKKRDARPFGLGDGVMNLEGGQNGFEVLQLKDVVDFLGPHTYYADTDPLRQAFNAEYCVRSLTHLGLPVLLEEFGCAATQASEANQALYYREAVHSCLTAGGAGALGWCFSDFDLEQDSPYNHQTFELGFGITRADGSEKPVCDELRAVAGLIDQVGFHRLEPPRTRAAILVPAYFNTSFPFSHEDRSRMRRTMLQAYALCAGAGIEVELVREEAAQLSRYNLVLAPSTQKLLTGTWRMLHDWVGEGNTLYWSYYAGDSPYLHGAWCHLIPQLTGCEHQLRYGLFDLPDGPFRLDGECLAVEAPTGGGPACRRSYLPICVNAAAVLGRDGSGRPALVENRVGRGRVIFLNHPLEHYLAAQATPDVAASTELYRLVARTAQVAPSVRSSDPRVQLRTVGVEGDRPLLWIFNHGWEQISCTVDVPAADPFHGADQPLVDGSQTLDLEPKQIAVYRSR